MYCGSFNVPCQLGAAEVGRIGVADHSTVERPNGQTTVVCGGGTRSRVLEMTFAAEVGVTAAG